MHILVNLLLEKLTDKKIKIIHNENIDTLYVGLLIGFGLFLSFETGMFDKYLFMLMNLQ